MLKDMWRWISRGGRDRAPRYHRTLASAAQGMTRIRDLRRLCRVTVYLVNRAVGLSNSALFLHHPSPPRYELAAVRYPHLMPKDLAFEETHAVVELLTRQRAPVLRRQWPGMGAWEWQALVPSFSNERLLGFLALGAKRTGVPYTPEDVVLFSTLASQAALGIENARFFEELRANEAVLIQSEKLATLGHLASGLMHELNNPLTIISGEAQVYLERFKGKDPEVDALLGSIIEEAHRASELTRRVARFAKPAQGGTRGAVNVRSLLDESLALASYPVRAKRIQRRLEVPDDLPAVQGEASQLQEVFLSLLLHACDAMGPEGGQLEVRAEAVDGAVEIRLTHPGPAMPARRLARLFDSSSDLRLFVSQRILQAQGGTLTASSSEGEGMTVTVRLAKAT